MTAVEPHQDPRGADGAIRYRRLALLWLFGQLVVVALLLLAGQPLIGVALIAVGYAGFLAVFDRRRSWWNQELRAQLPPKPPLGARIMSTVPLVLLTIVIVVVFFLIER